MDGKAGNSDPTLNIYLKKKKSEKSESPPVLQICIPTESLGESCSETRT